MFYHIRNRASYSVTTRWLAQRCLCWAIISTTPSQHWFGREQGLLLIGMDVIPANTRHWTNAGLMLAQRLRRWSNIKTALVQWCLVFAGIVQKFISRMSLHGIINNLKLPIIMRIVKRKVPFISLSCLVLNMPYLQRESVILINYVPCLIAIWKRK